MPDAGLLPVSMVHLSHAGTEAMCPSRTGPGTGTGGCIGYRAAKEQRRFYDWKGAEDGKTQEPDEDLPHGNSGGGLRSSRDFRDPGTLPHGPEAGAYAPPGMPRGVRLMKLSSVFPLRPLP